MEQLSDDQKNNLLKSKKDKENSSYKGMKCWAKCVDVYDGDTCTIKFFYRNEITQRAIRLFGIDTPEIHPKTLGRSASSIKKEKELALLAKRELSNMISGNKLIYIKFEEDDKYGRPLVTIYTDDKQNKSVNDIMIEKGHGIKYLGDHKQDFDNIHK